MSKGFIPGDVAHVSPYLELMFKLCEVLSAVHVHVLWYGDWLDFGQLKWLRADRLIVIIVIIAVIVVVTVLLSAPAVLLLLHCRYNDLSMVWAIRGSNLFRGCDLSLLQNVRPCSGAAQLPVQYVPGSNYLWVKAAEA
jgi:hypothetical protein